MSRNLGDLLFRFLFSLIFIGLGIEHVFSDELIQRMMPDWIADPRLISIASGFLLIVGGSMIALGYRLRVAAIMLGIFLILVTAVVHAPALSAQAAPVQDPADRWIWDTLQVSNFIKNLCLLGVCIMLPRYQMGNWSLETYLKRRSAG